MTWEQIAKLEPRLLNLYEKALSYHKKYGRKVDDNRVWYGRTGLKADMGRLVGWDSFSQNETLCSNTAYDICYRKLYSVLCGPGAM